MKQEYAERIAKQIEDNGEEGSSREYSGRGMYGDKTYAVVADLSTFIGAAVQVGIDLAEEAEIADEQGKEDAPDPEDFIEEMSKVRWDTMGRSSTVVY